MTTLGLLEIAPLPEPEDEYRPPKISTPGRLLVEIIGPGYGSYRYDIEVLDYDGETSVFWIGEGVGFDYWFDAHVDLEQPGFYVIEGITGTWIRGDGWTTDDDEEWDFELVRYATDEEVAHSTLGDLP